MEFHFSYLPLYLPRGECQPRHGSLLKQWFRTAKNRKVSTGPLVRLFSCLLVSLIHSLVPHCLHTRLRSFVCLLARLLTHSRARPKKNHLMSKNDQVLSHSALSVFIALFWPYFLRILFLVRFFNSLPTLLILCFNSRLAPYLSLLYSSSFSSFIFLFLFCFFFLSLFFFVLIFFSCFFFLLTSPFTFTLFFFVLNSFFAKKLSYRCSHFKQKFLNHHDMAFVVIPYITFLYSLFFSFFFRRPKS